MREREREREKEREREREREREYGREGYMGKGRIILLILSH